MRLSRLIPALVALMPLLPAAEPQPPRERVLEGINQFASELYPRLVHNGDNAVFSPFNVFTALSMALSGARGGTAKEMAAVLHQGNADTGYQGALAEVVGEMIKSATSGGTQLSSSNGLWVDKAFHIQADFRQSLQTLYGAPQLQLDFQANPDSAREEINRWTAEQTKGKIANLLGPGAVDRSTRLVLTSAIYFYGKWQSTFRPGLTHPAPFRLATGGTVEAPFMNQTGKFGYSETPSVQILEMKYADGGLGMDILLPKSPDALAELEKSISAENLGAWFRNLQTETVVVSLPKFRAETGFSLRKTLSQMGMVSAFQSDADFSGIDDRRDLALSDVVHKAFVDVSEEGTEAAAATGTVAFLASYIPPKPQIVFRADHPFVFLIRDTRSGAILFGGRLMKPANRN